MTNRLTQNLVTLMVFASLSFPALSFANDVTEMNGQKIVLLNESTVAEIEAVLAAASGQLTDEEKMEKIATALVADAVAANGFCDTAAATYGVSGGKPTPEKVIKGCMETFADTSISEGLVTGELMAQFPPGKSLREALSQTLSAFTVMFSTGVF